ncbi:protein SAAL1 [Leptonychotes weddellii]|uniref:Protein SAAL1 n=1 Tax=Leptonychotes weddellii TaxID=9713 RepID=A0A2U3Z013_LEPWE|nr:protein SAAL1 [Leptonychotes weddellii]
MDRNPSPPLPSRDQDEEEGAGGDCIGSTVYSKHWLFGVLSGLIQIVSPENTKSSSDDEQQMELDEEMENEICRVWDMSMDEDVALFLQEFNAPDIFMGVLAKSKCPRLREICVGILGNMACFQEICVSISSDKNLGQVLLHCLYDSDPPTLLETSRLLLTCLSQTEVASVWVERIWEYPAIYDSICFIMSSSTNVDLLVKVGEVVDKLFDLDEKLMLEWIRNGAVQPLDPPQEDSEEQPVFKIVPCVLEASKQVRSENPEGLDVYMHILQLLTTVDDGIQAIVQCPDTGKDTWNLLFDLVCHEFCQSDDPPIILQEQKTVLASVYSVLSAIYASQTEQEYLKIEEAGGDEVMDRNPSPPLPSRDQDEEEGAGGDCIGSTVYSKHWLFGVLSGLIQIVSPENTKSSSDDEQQMELDEEMENEICRVWDMSMDEIEDFLKILHEVDKTLADDLEQNFPSLKAQT